MAVCEAKDGSKNVYILMSYFGTVWLDSCRSRHLCGFWILCLGIGYEPTEQGAPEVAQAADVDVEKLTRLLQIAVHSRTKIGRMETLMSS